jgi:hypothetical protein
MTRARAYWSGREKGSASDLNCVTEARMIVFHRTTSPAADAIIADGFRVQAGHLHLGRAGGPEH